MLPADEASPVGRVLRTAGLLGGDRVGDLSSNGRGGG